ncbi:MAG: hypothetical protein JWN86_3322 [Planctomycetota bacterium]|nr:hypothetical protein [Planctomycetota bacterium]
MFMKWPRAQISTLMLVVAIAALVVALVRERRHAAELETALRRGGSYFGMLGD